MASFKTITTPDAPQPIGTYSQATEVNGFIFLSGQIGLAPNGTELVGQGSREQLEQIFRNIAAILSAKQADFSHIVKLTIYLRDLADFPMVNEAMKSHFATPYPARTLIQVSGLPKNAAVELDVIAVL